MSIEKFREFIQELINEDHAEEKVSVENGNDEAEMKYNYSAGQMELILEVSKLLDY